MMGFSREKSLAARRLNRLASQGGDEVEAESLGFSNSKKGRLDKAGFVTPKQKRLARSILLIGSVVIASGFSFLGFVLFDSRIVFALLGLLVGLYFALVFVWAWLSYCSDAYQRRVLFGLPIVIESLILLVESGLGILPAIQRVVKSSSFKHNPSLLYFNQAYQLSASGLSFKDALEEVSKSCEHKALKHVLVHLDISHAEGGEIVPALKNLSSHTYTEWKLSVEARVKKLENLVVFPVFASVIGLMLFTSAVPLVPVMGLNEKMKTKSPVVEDLKDQNVLKLRGVGESSR